MAYKDSENMIVGKVDRSVDKKILITKVASKIHIKKIESKKKINNNSLNIKYVV